ncbi:hypothetical protein [Luteibacter yeojuensis]|uniref:Uncharacterized protein n=1 Tax=Luteibacter yeojuensis TaxID=345309 RepID=A0A7X5TP78_9GAMM|nr:hypothetical protein [Luteibacter yeojuensis]NID14508.1 hypothetical protein [Luteibacter yeojuensis]
MDSYSIYLTTLKLDHGVNDTSTLFDRLRDHLSDELTKQGFAGASSSLDQYYWVDVDVGENPLRFWHFGIQLAPTPQDGGGIAVILREASDMRGPKYAPQPDELGANLRSKLKAAFQAAVSPGM